MIFCQKASAQNRWGKPAQHLLKIQIYCTYALVRMKAFSLP